MWSAIIFLVFAFVAVVAAINLVVQTHPISSALSLIGVMGSLAVLYLLLGAEFIAAAQLVVYAGAIMVLFVFVIMLLNAGAENAKPIGSRAKYFGLPLLIAFLGIMSFVVQAVIPGGNNVVFGEYHAGPRDVGKALFTDYLLPFEVVSVLILIAIIGAIVLARKEID
ncbi:MAG TPA: NADH-quinone oxidoreductase subunit J [Bryobacteraceae bacterium]|nr:NADH-quinone oxidoreductase subunit J [Bryobacteraceae bacterium]